MTLTSAENCEAYGNNIHGESSKEKAAGGSEITWQSGGIKPPAKLSI